MATIVNIADPNTPSNEVAVNNLGQIAISNFPSTQSIVGTVSVAQFPSTQPVSGTIDVTDRSARVLGHVIVDSGGSGTNTVPGYSVIQDGTINTRKLAINADGSINVSGATNASIGTIGSTTPTSATYIGASDGTNLAQLLVESSTNKNLRISIYNGGSEVAVVGTALKVDGSAVTQPISGTITAASQTGSATLSSVSASATTVSILASNASRKGMYLFNDSNSALYLAFASTSSLTAYTVKIPAASFFEMPTAPIYTGAISALWDVATGAARITELA